MSRICIVYGCKSKLDNYYYITSTKYCCKESFLSLLHLLVLGIETSCDETGVALYHTSHGLLSHALYSQTEMHGEYGGVVPELASRDHIRRVLPLIRQTLAAARLELHDLDAIAYTQGPGLAGALLVGASIAVCAWLRAGNSGTGRSSP